MFKLYILIFLFLSVGSAFSQMKISKDTPITNGNPVYLKYVKATITPPKNYAYLEDYTSFINHGNQTSISVATNAKLSYDEMVSNLLNKDYKVEDAKLISEEKVDGGHLFTFLFMVNNQKVERMMFVTGDEKHAIYVMANYRQVDRLKYRKMLKACILSIKF